MKKTFSLQLVFIALMVTFFPQVPAHAGKSEVPTVVVLPMSGRGSKVLTADEVEGLTDYLSAKLGEDGSLLVISKDDIRKYIAAKKREFHNPNFDTSSQLEMGKELAAEFSISSAITKVGSTCLIYASVWDNARATQIKAATAKESCNPDRLIGAVEIIAAKLKAAMTGVGYKEPEKTEQTETKVAHTTPTPSTGLVKSKYMALPASSFAPSDTIKLTWSGVPSYRNDWIALAQKGMGDDNYLTYMYTGGKKEGKYSFSGLEPGEYEARFYLNYNKVGYKAADRIAFSVGQVQKKVSRPTFTGGTHSKYLQLDRDVFTTDEKIEVHWVGTPGNRYDWICVVPQKSPDTDAGTYAYTSTKDGSFTVEGLEPGEYEVRFYLDYSNKGYKVSDRLHFSVR